MEFLWIALGIVLILVAVFGCVFPALPGSPLAYIALLLLLLIDPQIFSTKFLIIMAIMHIAVQIFDFILPMVGAKRFGASKAGVWGSLIGMFIGMIFFPPFGIFIGVLIGAIVGELWVGKKSDAALKAGIASFAFSMLSLVIKLIVIFITAWYFIKAAAGIVGNFI